MKKIQTIESLNKCAVFKKVLEATKSLPRIFATAMEKNTCWILKQNIYHASWQELTHVSAFTIDAFPCLPNAWQANFFLRYGAKACPCYAKLFSLD